MKDKEDMATRPPITTATVIPKLKGLLIADINMLDNMLLNKDSNSELSKFITSLKNAKLHIFSMLPNDEHNDNEIPTTNQKSHMESVAALNAANYDNQVKIAKLLLKIEESQMNFVKHSVSANGLPKEIKTLMLKILDKYLAITEQLNRSTKTNTLQTIIL